MFYKIDAIKDFAMLTAKNLYWSLFSIKLQAFGFTTLFKRDFNTGAFL